MTKWTKEYDNDTGPCDDYFEEWWNVTDGNHIYRCKNSDDADFLIAALAQPEPVAWEQFYPEMGSPKLAYLSPTESSENACYTPPQRKPLTDEEIEKACVPLGAAMLSFTEVARAIEAAHGIKENT